MTKRHRVLLTMAWPEPAMVRLAENFDLSVHRDAPIDKAALIDAMHNFEAICPTPRDRIDADVLQTPGAKVRLIANYGAGFEHIDLAAASAANILVSNTPGILTEATADVAILLMLMATRRAGEGERALRAGKWPGPMLGTGLAGKTLGLVGFGRIAQAVAAKAASAFGMRIIYHGRRPAAPEVLSRIDATFFESLHDLLAASDIVSLHCPGGAETHHLIDRDALAVMKRSAVLINTARGSVVDEAALLGALVGGEIASAGLDVYEHEPRVNPALLALENVVLLPHIGSATTETRMAMAMRAAENVECFFSGRPLLDQVLA